MFDLANSSNFFRRMDAEHPTLVQNIDVVNENRRQLDAAYHRPKHFILSLNNLLRSLLFFVENSVKNTPAWLHDSVVSFKVERQRDHEILRYLRNVSAHQKLVLPDEALNVGLYRIRSTKSYLLKIGAGDRNKPRSYAPDFTLKNTEDIFDDLISFPSIAFMDLEHSAIGECLGLTRRWFYKINFRSGQKRVSEVVDVYSLTSSFSSALLDTVCQAFAEHKCITYDQRFSQDLSEYNYVNTLLEIDLYPSLFSKWWQERCEPLNYGVRVSQVEAEQYRASDEFYQWVYETLPSDAHQYEASLEKFLDLGSEALMEEPYINEFLSFVVVNHWHFKKAFRFGDAPISPSDVMTLQRIGKTMLDAYRKETPYAIEAARSRLNTHMQKMLEAIKTARTKRSHD